MEKLRQYEIPFRGLKSGTYEYNFEIGDALLSYFEAESQGVFGGGGTATLQLTKRSEMMLLHLRTDAQVVVECDFCLDTFETRSTFEGEITAKFGDESDDHLGEVIILGASEDILNVAQFIYEYIIYGLPFQRVHPEGANGKPGCNPKMLERLDNMLVEDDKPDEDPRWAELRKLKGD